MEEQRARQEDEARKAVAASVSEAGTVQKMDGTLSICPCPARRRAKLRPYARYVCYFSQ